ncbi:hypothetical protein H6763_02910 [Candidatus Nomurabacteria bacterium]|uniref:DUF948 domain-containing protein n=1 Tax=Candidatus Dojkabacteria bacterium TaxID=2099670 RepID=A0A955I1X4_9BACT|nr:hypothetical protein [Candidatus Dojkabacteria bacterium]MCB9789434.1 hypothetical protein [Candidatus Nomurabacteria bacterium]MCB9803756.1 hypothetical protein [Candidatus Nomurabacteria bacterium]
MDNQIPAVFWMVVISGLSILLGMILYYLAMILREATNTMSEVTKTVQKSNVLLDDAAEVVSVAKTSAKKLEETVDEVNKAIIVPVRSIGSVLHTVSGFIEGFRDNSE